jgi:hypothetical protein
MAVPVAVERLVVGAGRLVEIVNITMPGNVRRRATHAARMFVVAVVAVDRLGDQIAGTPDAGFGEGPRRRAEVVRAEPDRDDARTGSSSSGT